MAAFIQADQQSSRARFIGFHPFSHYFVIVSHVLRPLNHFSPWSWLSGRGRLSNRTCCKGCDLLLQSSSDSGIVDRPN